MTFKLECEREEDGRWLAEGARRSGIYAHGASADEAVAEAQVWVLRVLAEPLEHGEALALDIGISFIRY